MGKTREHKNSNGNILEEFAGYAGTKKIISTPIFVGRRRRGYQRGTSWDAEEEEDINVGLRGIQKKKMSTWDFVGCRRRYQRGTSRDAEEEEEDNQRGTSWNAEEDVKAPGLFRMRKKNQRGTS
ncbi:uncharacterized protein LOC143349750 isoform X2 [Colletes latitarsis]|uniref:uncharacterized protein LOC143349750 isoform X2 n=1 Tax=Colletes latitarsis TaxID=2605962 RepID=UPI004036B01C